MMLDVLSSDILEGQFGPTKVEILRQDDSDRIICTKSIETGQTLEISHVEFIAEGVSQFPKVHRNIVDGQSMGKAFRAAGVPFVREVYAGYSYDLPDGFKQYFQIDRPAAVLRVRILVGREQLPYADILETYHPDVDWGRLNSDEPEAELMDRMHLVDHFLATL
jgi:hypothetical protein